MRFWDTSAIVPLLMAEAATPAVSEALRGDPELLVWWATGTECVSALARVERGEVDAAESFDRLDMLAEAWHEVAATDPVRRTAARLLRTHTLRAAEALQLAAAIVASEGEPRTLPFVTFDERLADAASREGFPVVRPSASSGTR
ncbi:MAG: PIN domain-containing protein [Chloroflexota bacterium]|nr:PIN domain-containing protein [Chloroflexota bacterium]